jgi:hypothetical protein
MKEIVAVVPQPKPGSSDDKSCRRHWSSVVSAGRCKADSKRRVVSSVGTTLKFPHRPGPDVLSEFPRRGVNAMRCWNLVESGLSRIAGPPSSIMWRGQVATAPDHGAVRPPDALVSCRAFATRTIAALASGFSLINCSKSDNRSTKSWQ